MGSITLTLSVVAVFLLVLGLPLVRGLNTKKNLQRHGILTAVALALQAVLIFVLMIPSLIYNFDPIIDLSIAFSFNTWLHVILGSAAFVSGFAFIAIWLTFYSSGMRCATAKKYMMPTLIVWVVAVISGALIFLLEMF
jgi:hypothetical protein